MAYWWVLFLLSANGLALNSSPTKIVRVVSTKKDGGLSKTFTFDADPANLSSIKRVNKNGDHSLSHSVRQVQAALRSTFLPSGYPTSTPPGYLLYSMWSWIQDITTQLRSVLATQRVLEGVGVGREGATALSALMNFLVRDGCGMAATLMFTSVASSRFKTDVKRWRIFADVMVDIGITLEVAAILVPRPLFLPMICVGNMCKAMCGVAAGACGGAINLHWARGSDISDINAKFGAQHTITGSLGLVFAAVFARSVSRVNQTTLWTLYSMLTLLHIIANMQCMKLIAFDSFNNARMNLIMAEFFSWWNDKEPQQPTINAPEQAADSVKPVQLSSPHDIAKVEPLFFVGTGRGKLSPVPIRFGVSFDEFSSITGRSESELEFDLLQSTQSNYLIAAGSRGRSPCVVVSFLSSATPVDQAKAYYHATLLGFQLKNQGATDSNAMRAAEANARDELDRSWYLFTQACQESGWDLKKTELQSCGYGLELSNT